MATEVGSLYVKLGAKTAEFKKKMAGVQRSMEEVAAKAKAVAVKAGVAFAALSVAVFKVANTYADFELGMARVGAVSRASAVDMKNLTQAARGLAAATEFSAKEVAEGMGFMAMAGMESNQIIAAMPSVLQLASAGMIDLGTASDITTNIVAGMGLSLEELADANDTLVAAMTGANVDARMLGEAFKYVGPVARSAGWTFEGVTAALGKLGNAGIQGSMAGTTLRNVISRLLNPVGEAADEIDRLGLNVMDSSGKLRPLTEIIRQLEPHAEDTAAIMKIFGNRAGPGMAALLEVGSRGLSDFTDRLLDSRGVAKEISERVLKTFSGQMKILNSKWEEAKIAIGEGLVVPLRAVNRVLQLVMDAFNSLSPGVKAFAGYALFAGTALAGIIAAVATLLVVLPLVTGAAATAGAAMAAAFWPVTIAVVAILAGIAQLVLTIGVLKKVWDANLFGMRDTMTSFINATSTAWDWWSEKAVTAWDWWADVAKKILKKVGEWIETWVNHKLGILRRIGEALDIKSLAGLRDIEIDLTFEEGKNALLVAAKFWGGEIKKGADFIADAWGEGVDVIKNILGPFADNLTAAMAGVTGAGAVAAGGVMAGKGVRLPKAAEKAADSAQEASIALDIMSSALSEFGEGGKVAADIITLAAQGFAEGGLVGAIMSVLMRILSTTATFGRILNMFANMLMELGKAIEPVLLSIEPLLGVLAELIVALTYLVVAIDPFTALIIKLGPVFEWSVGKLGWFLDLMVGVWNWMVGVMAGFAKKIPKIGKAIARWIEDFKIERVDLGRRDRDDAVSGLEGLGYAAGGAADSLRDLSESLQNVPEGFKVLAARFEAMDPEAMPLPGDEDEGGAAADGGVRAETYIESLTIIADDPENAWERMKDAQEQDSFLETGTIVASTSRLATGSEGA